MKKVQISAILCICIFAAIAASLFPVFASQNEIDTDPQNTLVRSYIDYLASANTVENRKTTPTFSCEYPGMGTESSALPDMTLEDAEKSGLLSPALSQTNNTISRASHNYSVAVQQHNLIVSQFGETAWDNVTYTLEEIEPVDGTLGFKIVATGELITREKYDQLLRDYWNEIAVQEKVSYYDIFLSENEDPENIKNKRVDLITAHAENIPVKPVTVSDSKTYQVSLAFNGKTTSEDGYDRFHFIIDNRNGDWSVFQGLTWAEPYPEYPEGD